MEMLNGNVGAVVFSAEKILVIEPQMDGQTVKYQFVEVHGEGKSEIRKAAIEILEITEDDDRVASYETINVIKEDGEEEYFFLHEFSNYV